MASMEGHAWLTIERESIKQKVYDSTPVTYQHENLQITHLQNNVENGFILLLYDK